MPPENPNSRRPKSSTTVFAIKYAGGAVIAGDRRTGESYHGIASDSSIKIQQISEFSAMACAGYCNVIDHLETNMTSVCNRFKQSCQRQLSPDGQAKYLQDLLEGWWFLYLHYWYWNYGVPVLAAYDTLQEQPRIFSFSEDGYYFEPDFMAGAGCGWEGIKNIIYSGWKKNLKKNAAIDLAIKAQLLSGLSSSGVSDSRISLPSIGIIDKNGFKWVEDKEIAKRRDAIVKRMGALNAGK